MSDPIKRCKAKSKGTGQQCKNPVVPGKEVCRYHGGLTPSGIASPHFKHGRYSKVLPSRLMGRYEEALRDPELLNLTEEIAVSQAREGELMTRLDGQQDPGPARWREVQRLLYEFADLTRQEGKGEEAQAAFTAALALVNKAITDYHLWDEIKDLQERRRRLVESERDRRMEMQTMITVEQVQLVMTRWLSAIQTIVRDRDTLNAIQAEYTRIAGQRE